MRESEGFTDDVVRALAERYSSAAFSARDDEGSRRGWGARGTWLFFRCSGVARGEGEMEEGAKVGDESALDGDGSVVGSKSRSGTVGVTRGLFVVRSNKTRSAALFRKVSTATKTHQDQHTSQIQAR